VTGDGLADILVPGHGNGTVLVVHQVRGTLRTAEWSLDLGRQPWVVAGDDLDGDGRNDIIAVVTDGISVWFSGPERYVPAPGSPFPASGATEIATGDIDGDGVSEIAIGTWDGDEVILLAGRTLDRRSVPACKRPVGLAIADLDGDGRGELLIACATTGRLIVMSWPRGG
jgi:hypothetical protein